MTTKQKTKLHKKNGGKCLKCGTTENLTIDHIVPEKFWLKYFKCNSYQNYQTLCFDCNVKKGQNIISYRQDAYKFVSMDMYRKRGGDLIS